MHSAAVRRELPVSRVEQNDDIRCLVWRLNKLTGRLEELNVKGAMMWIEHWKTCHCCDQCTTTTSSWMAECGKASETMIMSLCSLPTRDTSDEARRSPPDQVLAALPAARQGRSWIDAVLLAYAFPSAREGIVTRTLRCRGETRSSS